MRAKEYDEASDDGLDFAEEPDKKLDAAFTILLVGDNNVGKSCLKTRYITSEYVTNKQNWILLYLQVENKDIVINKKNIRLTFYDTSCNENYPFHDMLKLCGNKMDAVAIVFDLTCQQSFKNCEYYLKTATNNTKEDIAFILVGTKSDLIKERQVSEEDAKKFARRNNMAYIETSAKEDINVTPLFGHLIREIMIENDKSHCVNSYRSPHQKIQQSLKQYVERIEKHQSNNQINFAYGFWFLRTSRARNRAANYYLAKSLIQKLADQDSTHSFFRKDTLAKERNKQIKMNNIGSQLFKPRGINSHELNQIIRDARKLQL